MLTIDRSKIWTTEAYLQLGEINTPCELIDGALYMSPSPKPSHQEIVGNLYDFIKAAARKAGGKVYFSPIDLFIGRNVLQPDLIYLSSEKLSLITSRGIEGAPDLVVEVTSPHNSFTDRNKKKTLYLDFGIKEYWIIDPALKTLEVYTPEGGKDAPTRFFKGTGLVSSSVVVKLSFNLQDLFNT